MRHLYLAAAAAALTLAATPSLAGSCCQSTVSYYGIGPVVSVEPRVGFELTPSAQLNPVYVVNQGPFVSGPGIYTYSNIYYPTARPIYSESIYSYAGYAGAAYSYATPYSYARPYPYVRTSWGLGYRGCGGCAFGRSHIYRRYGGASYRAYRYTAVPGPRLITLPSTARNPG
jgi:hypothetical protein